MTTQKNAGQPAGAAAALPIAAHITLARTAEQLIALTRTAARLADDGHRDGITLAFLAADMARPLPGLINAARIEALTQKETLA